MITGMTGFGSADMGGSLFRGSVEIKTQNHRYLDISFYLPTGCSSLEERIRQMVSKELRRGRVNIAIKINEKNTQHVVVNDALVEEYLKNARAISKKYGIDNDLRLSDFIRMPGVMETREVHLREDEIWRFLEGALKKAVRSVVMMRKREGRALAADMGGILTRMTLQVKTVQARLKKILAEKKKDRPPEEFSSFQKSNDVSEEITRLQHYVQEYKALLKGGAGVGKKMDFIAQEMQRETNTIGSKVQDTVISNAVIALKSKIEKLREQAQNIE